MIEIEGLGKGRRRGLSSCKWEKTKNILFERMGEVASVNKPEEFALPRKAHLHHDVFNIGSSNRE